MKKSYVSKDQIQADFMNIEKYEFKDSIGRFSMFLIYSVGAWLLIGWISEAFAIAAAIFLLPIAYFGYKLLVYVLKMREIAQAEFTVLNEVLSKVGSEKEFTPKLMPRYVRHGALKSEYKQATSPTGIFTFRTVSVLKFPAGTWFIPESLYEWSRENKMSYADIRDTSEVGDEFYVVVYNKSKKIGCAYNKKFFNLIERPRHDEKPEEKVFH